MTQTSPNTPKTFRTPVKPGDAVVHVETGAIGEIASPNPDDEFLVSLMLRGVAPRDQVLVLWEDAQRPEFWAWERRADVRR